MAQTVILAVGSSAATSTDVTLAAGASAILGIYVSTGTLPAEAKASVYIDSPAVDAKVACLSNASPTVMVSGPGTFRVAREPGPTFGIWSET